MNKLLAKKGDAEKNIQSLTSETRHKLSTRFKMCDNDISQSKLNETVQTSKNRQQLSSLDVFRQIVKERHVLAQKQDKDGYAKFNRKLLSPTLRMGIVTRAFSRSKLEIFTRSDPEQLKTSLKCRVNSIILKAYLAEPCMKGPREPATRPFRHLTTTGHSKSILSQSQSNLLAPQQGKQNLRFAAKGKQLNLKDFAEERTQIQHLQQRIHSANTQKARRARENLSLIIKPVWGGTAPTNFDFLPSDIKLSARRDKQIIDAFKSSVCLSTRGSLMNARPSHSRDHG
jgi:hypothetical protein